MAEALKHAWPSASAGAIRRWRLDPTDEAHPVLEVVHLGPALGGSGEALLASLLSDRFHVPLVVRDVAIPGQAVAADAADGATWLPALTSAVDWVRGEQGLTACVTLPPDPGPPRGKRRRRPTVDLAPIRKAALAELTRAPASQVHSAAGPRWTVQLRPEACEELVAAP